MISDDKWAALRRRMEKLKILEEDLSEQFIRGSGSGGQKINKTSSCVQLNHAPTGIEIRSQKTRSQADNRYHARSSLCEKIEEQVLGLKTKRIQAQEKLRRQKRRRSRRAKNKMLDAKNKQGQKKDMRRRPGSDDWEA